MAVILIVEDDLFIRELTEMTIQGWDHVTLVAGDVDEALLVLRSPQHIDILFTDIYLAAAANGGCELAHRALGLRPKLHVLYTTGNTLTKQMTAQFVAGSHCLRKPYTPDQLRSSFDGLLAA